MTAASNFLILYNSREGSSAIINHLSGQAGVNVPIFEELDPYLFKPGPTCPDIYSAIDEVFTSGSYSGRADRNPALQPLSQEHSTQVIGFKWRPHGNFLKLINLCKRHNVTVFFLSRENYLDLVCSAYVQLYGNEMQPDHDVPQYPYLAARTMSDEEKGTLMETMRTACFQMDRGKFLRASRLRERYKFKHWLLFWFLRLGGVRTMSILYEDYCDNPNLFIKNFISQIAPEMSFAINSRCDISRVHTKPLADRIDDIEHTTKTGFSGLRFGFRKRLYDFYVRKIHRVAIKDS